MSMTATDVLEAGESHRRELTAFCYRFLGSQPEAEDAVQEVLVKAWRGAEDFRGASSLRTWLYRIATNTCLDMGRAPQRRALPMDLAGPGAVPDDPSTLAIGPASRWVGPIADHAWASADPAEQVATRDTVRLAFVAALQALPPRQRAVLLLRDVLDWSAADCADLLDTSVDAVTSALARARRTMADRDPGPTDVDDGNQAAMLEDYVAAFEAYDVDRLVDLLAADAEFSMPPYALWLRGRDSIEAWWRGPGTVCVGSRTIVTSANGQPSVGVYHPVSAGRWAPFAVHVLDVRRRDGDLRLQALTHFMGPEVFARLGLPDAVVDERVSKPSARSAHDLEGDRPVPRGRSV